MPRRRLKSAAEVAPSQQRWCQRRDGTVCTLEDLIVSHKGDVPAAMEEWVGLDVASPCPPPTGQPRRPSATTRRTNYHRDRESPSADGDGSSHQWEHGVVVCAGKKPVIESRSAGQVGEEVEFAYRAIRRHGMGMNDDGTQQIVAVGDRVGFVRSTFLRPGKRAKAKLVRVLSGFHVDGLGETTANDDATAMMPVPASG